MTIFGREPAFWIGLIVTIILGALGTISGEGLISDAATGQVTNAVNAISQLVILLAPLVTGLLIRPGVTSVAQPSLDVGTSVLIRGTNDDPPGEAIVTLK